MGMQTLKIPFLPPTRSAGRQPSFRVFLSLFFIGPRLCPEERIHRQVGDRGMHGLPRLLGDHR